MNTMQSIFANHYHAINDFLWIPCSQWLPINLMQSKIMYEYHAINYCHSIRDCLWMPCIQWASHCSPDSCLSSVSCLAVEAVHLANLLCQVSVCRALCRLAAIACVPASVFSVFLLLFMSYYLYTYGWFSISIQWPQINPEIKEIHDYFICPFL